MKQRNSILLSLASVVVMFLLYFGTENGMFGENPVGRTGNYNEPLIVPSPYAFAIWGVIYMGLLALPIYHWFKRQVDHQLWISFRHWFSLNVVLNGLWLAAASFDWLCISVAIIIGMLISLFKMRSVLAQLKSENVSLNYWLEEFVVHIYFAWITLATVLNIAAALTMYNWDGFGVSPVAWSLIILPVAAIIGSLVFFKFKDKAYAGVVVWAFVALIVKHIVDNPTIAYLAIVVAIIFAFYVIKPQNKLAFSSIKKE